MTDEKTLFATIRQIAGRGLTQQEVDAVHAALYRDIVGAPARRLSDEGVKLIQTFESYEATTYVDPKTGGKPYTGGWGSTTDEFGHPLPLGVTWPQERWLTILHKDIALFENGVNTLLGNAPTTQNQFDALVSFAYNVGLDIDEDTVAEGLGDSTLLRKHLAGDYTGAQAEFGRWINKGTSVEKGLTRRRAIEAALYGRA